jgi:membrane protein implicated in regulation of membrane protease activity
LVRRKYLRERYALIWIVTGSLFLLLSIRVQFLYGISSFLGFTVPSNTLFFFGILFLLSIVLGLSVITSRLTEKNKILTQEVVLLEKRVADLEKSNDAENPNL